MDAIKPQLDIDPSKDFSTETPTPTLDQLASDIRAHLESAEQASEEALASGYCKAGLVLIQAKEQVKRGNGRWLEWLNAENINPRTAQRAMRIAAADNPAAALAAMRAQGKAREAKTRALAKKATVTQPENTSHVAHADDDDRELTCEEWLALNMVDEALEFFGYESRKDTFDMMWGLWYDMDEEDQYALLSTIAADLLPLEEERKLTERLSSNGPSSAEPMEPPLAAAI